MASVLPPDVQKLVSEMLAGGQYDCEASVMREALRLLKQRDDLRRDVRQGIAELDRGEGIDSQTVFRELREKAGKLSAPDA